MITKGMLENFRISFTRTFRTPSSEIYDMVKDGNLVGTTNVHIGRKMIKATMSLIDPEIDEQRAILAMHLLNLVHLEGIEVDSDLVDLPRVLYDVTYADGVIVDYGFDDSGNLLDWDELEDEELVPLDKQYVYFHPRIKDSLIAYPNPISGLKQASLQDVLEDEFFEQDEIGCEFVLADGLFLYLGDGEFKKIG